MLILKNIPINTLWILDYSVCTTGSTPFLHNDLLLYQYKWRRFFYLFQIHYEWNGCLGHDSLLHSLKHTNWQLALYRLNTCITITDLHRTRILPSIQIEFVQSSDNLFSIVLQVLRLMLQEVEVSYHKSKRYLHTAYPQNKTTLFLLKYRNGIT